jgi:hypothetical protein
MLLLLPACGSASLTLQAAWGRCHQRSAQQSPSRCVRAVLTRVGLFDGGHACS